jgi:hypothetical protein
MPKKNGLDGNFLKTTYQCSDVNRTPPDTQQGLAALWPLEPIGNDSPNLTIQGYKLMHLMHERS